MNNSNKSLIGLIRYAAALLFILNGFNIAAQDFVKVEQGYRYSDISSANPVNLVYHVSQPEITIIRQWGTSDPHLFYDKDCKNMVAMTGYSSSSDGSFLLEYLLGTGDFYFHAPLNDSDPLNSVMFDSPETTDLVDVLSIDHYINTDYKKIWEFRPEFSGIIEIETNLSRSLVTGGSNMLFTDLNRISAVTCDSYTEGYHGLNYYFHVNEGETYYLWCNVFDTMRLRITKHDGVMEDVKLISIDPEPGLSFDAVNYPNGLRAIFQPAAVQFESVEFQYVVNGQTIVEPVKGCFYMGEGWSIPIASLYSRAQKEADKGSQCSIVMKGVNFNGSPLAASAVENVIIEDGTLSFSYSLSGAPTVIEEYWPDVFYAYWETGVKEGIAVLTMSEDVQSVGEVSIMMGHHSAGETAVSDPIYTLTPQFEGDKIYLDFTGVRRSERGYKEVTIMISSITGTGGLQANFGSSANLFEYLNYSDSDSPYVSDTPEEPENPADPEDPADPENPDNPDDPQTPEEPNEPEEPQPDVPEVPDTPTEIPEASLIYPLGEQTELKLMRVTWDYVELAPGEMTVSLTLPDGTEESLESIIIDYNPNDTEIMPLILRNNALQIDIPESYTMPGTYLLVIPEGTVLISDEPNPEEQFTLVVIDSGEGSVTGIKPDAEGFFRVYSLNGIMLKQTSDASDIKSLPEGIYLINGEKVVIRK